MMLGVQAEPELISRVRSGLTDEDDRPHYGFPGVAELMYDIAIESKIDKNNEHRVRVN